MEGSLSWLNMAWRLHKKGKTALISRSGLPKQSRSTWFSFLRKHRLPFRAAITFSCTLGSVPEDHSHNSAKRICSSFARNLQSPAAGMARLLSMAIQSSSKSNCTTTVSQLTRAHTPPAGSHAFAWKGDGAKLFIPDEHEPILVLRIRQTMTSKQCFQRLADAACS